METFMIVKQTILAIHTLYATRKKVIVNKAQCQRLTERLELFVLPLERLKKEKSPHPDLQKLLCSFELFVEECKQFIRLFKESNWFKKVFINNIYKQEFEDLNNCLRQYAINLGLGYNILKAFDKEQDEIDQEIDLNDIHQKHYEILRLINEQSQIQVQHETIRSVHQKHNEKLINSQKGIISIKSSLEQRMHQQKNKKQEYFNDLHIPDDELQLVQSIGSGAFSKVHLGTWSSRCQTVAIKKLHLSDMDKQMETQFTNEVSTLCRIRYEHVVSVFGACIRPNAYAIVVEHMPLGSLFDVLRKKDPILTNHWSILSQIIKSINYLHMLHPPIFHRDIKSTNFLLKRSNKEDGYLVKVCDFGLSETRRESTRQTHMTCGTLQWMAPEIMKMEKYTEKSDVYSLGTVLWELVTNKIPYNEVEESTIRSTVLAGERLEIPFHVPEELRQIILRCWSHNPRDRPSCYDLLLTVNLAKQQSFFPTIPRATLPRTTLPRTTLPRTTLPRTTLPRTTLPRIQKTTLPRIQKTTLQ
ncbi:unnamed protein product [Didymodactylos carnosus]|uniref:Protein kinase domain-containing protein n=2 Tax=Didymodactylos carnosus TaxID=1234261 RepID=A0A815I4S2_9BILA|nr:unnamed protein product [Didymodactylos carnosus]CAF4237877.1 unnamed protein product [Didymodactylos carnosus]